MPSNFTTGLFLLFGSTLLLGGPAGGQAAVGQGARGSAQHPDSSASSVGADCRRFVQSFYKWYRGAVEHGGYEIAIEKKGNLFSPGLLRELRGDLAADRKNPGEIVGLDFDPFLNSQDFADRYEVGKLEMRGDAYLADIYAIRGRTRPAHPALVAVLRKQRGHWVFTNFHYPASDPHSKSDDLLSILAKLKADRTKKR